MKDSSFHLYVVILSLWFSVLSAFSQNILPQKYFDTQYCDAIEKVKTEKKKILFICNQNKLNPAVAISVVFPEMLRYSMWRDMFETEALNLLYVQFGPKSADFSIGWFQMKPSFAEKVEIEILNSPYLRLKYNSLVEFGVNESDSIKCRKERLNRLHKFDWQLLYLQAFMELQTDKLGISEMDEETKLTLLAAAYNRGMDKSKAELLNFSSLKTFPYGPGSQNPFGYAELALYFYWKEAGGIFKLNKSTN